jgi:hypothetical protein
MLDFGVSPIQEGPCITDIRFDFHAYACAELHELWNRSRGHLRHHACAMNFDGLLANAEFRSNLLI